LRDLVGQQIRMNSEIKVKLAANDRILEDINVKMDSFSAAIEDQLKFNKKIEEKIKQLATELPTDPEQVRAITTRGGRSTKDPPYPKRSEKSTSSTTSGRRRE
jgi:RNA processing factor Prp31